MRLPRPVRAVVFDMDGLLVDSESLYAEALVAEAAKMGFELRMDVVRRMIGSASPDIAGILRDEFGAGFDVDRLWVGATERAHQLSGAKVALKAGVVELLDRLDDLGLPRALCTSSHHRSVDRNLTPHDLRRRFDAILAFGDYPRPKPAPDPYLAAAHALGMAPQDCLALEDSHNGVRSAAAAGLMTVMVPDLLHPDEEMRTLALHVARDLHEVRRMLGG